MAGHPPASSLQPQRILVRGVNWLGDAVMTTPALLRLREKFPEARIALLTPAKLAGLWQTHPAVNETVSFAPEEGLLTVAARLRAGKYDLALVLPNSPRSALEVFLAGIPRRIGYARPWRNFFLTQTVPPRAGAVKMRKRSVTEIKRLTAAHAGRTQTSTSGVLTNTATTAHQIHEYLHLAAALGADPEPLAPQLCVTPEEIEAARQKFGLGAVSATIMGLNPGAEYGPAKRWPAGRFLAAAQQLHARNNCFWLLFGGKGDADITGEIASGLRASRIAYHDLAGRTTLRELMALLKLCRVLLTNDSGPMHVAAALGTPVVAPFGSTSPELTGPGLPGDPRHRLLKSDAPCAPCFLRECPIDFRCLNGIGIDRVVAAVVEALGH
jgi:heptosyltransferase-2